VVWEDQITQTTPPLYNIKVRKYYLKNEEKNDDGDSGPGPKPIKKTRGRSGRKKFFWQKTPAYAALLESRWFLKNFDFFGKKLDFRGRLAREMAIFSCFSAPLCAYKRREDDFSKKTQQKRTQNQEKQSKNPKKTIFSQQKLCFFLGFLVFLCFSLFFLSFLHFSCFLRAGHAAFNLLAPQPPSAGCRRTRSAAQGVHQTPERARCAGSARQPSLAKTSARTFRPDNIYVWFSLAMFAILFVCL